MFKFYVLFTKRPSNSSEAGRCITTVFDTWINIKSKVISQVSRRFIHHIVPMKMTNALYLIKIYQHINKYSFIFCFIYSSVDLSSIICVFFSSNIFNM